MSDRYDLIVVGGGPAGYQAAQLAGRAGMRVLLAERDAIGGTCLNHGCIPTKTLLRSAKLYHEMLHAEVYGLTAGQVAVHMDRLQARKRDIIDKLQIGVMSLLKRGKVELMTGAARVPARGTVIVNNNTYTAGNILIATGAAPVRRYPGTLATTDALSLRSVPASLGIIGGGPISFGLASIFEMMGSEVTIVEPGLVALPDADDDLRAALLAALPSVTVRTETETVEADVVVENIGRAPALGAVEELRLDVSNGGVHVDEHMRTNLPGVYAAGDVTGRAMWAHVALREAEVAVNHMMGQPDRMRYHAVPTPIYTVPEAAYVGLTERAAHQAGYAVRVHRLPMNANGRFLIEAPGQSGLCKVVTDAETGVVLGVHLVGGQAAESIFGVAAMLEDEFRAAEIRELVFAHPTVSEIIKDSLQ